MGGDFTFIGNQYHLMIGSRYLYIDLLLFHRRLRSLIAIELKIGEFEAEYVGKMQMYLSALDEQVNCQTKIHRLVLLFARVRIKHM